MILEIGKVYKFRSGARIVLSEPEIDIDGIEKVRTARAPICSSFVSARDPLTPLPYEIAKDLDWKYAPTVLLDKDFTKVSPEDWSHVKSATHEMSIVRVVDNPYHGRKIGMIAWKKLKK